MGHMKIFKTVLTFLICMLFFEVQCLQTNTNNENYVLPKDAYLLTPGFVEKYGFVGETHTTITEDGYTLTMHRILGRKNEKLSTKKPAVFLLSGFASTSVYYIINGPQLSLGLILADQGYDVWLGNQRGSFYSTEHKTYKRKFDKEYWKYSFHEIGYYDIAAMIDYILQNTKKSKLHVVAHSQGAMAFFALASERPQYNNKIITMHAMGPIAYMQYTKNEMFVNIAKYYDIIKFGADFLNLGEMFQKSEFSFEFASRYCHEKSPMFLRCFKQFFGDEDVSLYNTSMMPIYASHHYAGSSFYPLLHIAQLILSAKFEKYNHDPLMNMVLYGTLDPPSYKIDRITAPVALHYCTNDTTASLSDVLRLKRELSNVIAAFEITRPKFNHLSFLLSPSASEDVYPNLIKTMKEYDERELKN